ncbi:MAG: LPXTG cell wall anchor domain-containing protein [Christensenellales bacterium]|jgi:LPXTG-motif cell wall-anchored protein
MSKLFKRSLALLAVLTLLFALAVPTVLAEGTEDEDLPEEDEVEFEEELDEDLPDEDEVTDDEEVPATGDFAQAGIAAAAAVVVAAGALVFTMKRARD